MAQLEKFTTKYIFETDRRGAREAQRTIDNIRRSLDQVSKQFLIFGTALTAGLGKIGHHSYRFSGEMNRLRRDTRATDAQFKALREQAIKLGSSVEYTTITISDAVRAQRELVKGGLSIQQAMKALPNVLNFVAATEIAVGDSALYTTKIMKGFKLEVKDIPMIHDSIAHAATSMGITHEQLSKTLMRVSATANAAGINLKDMTSMLSVMVDEGMIAERSATSLERTVSVLARAEILPPNAQDALKGMGLSLRDLSDSIKRGEILPLFEQLRQGGLDVAKANVIFGEDGARAALKLTNSVGNLRNFRDTMNDIEGVMRKQADTMNDNLFGAINALISAWDAFQISLGQAGIAQVLKKVTIRITELVGDATNMDDKWKKLIATILLAGPVLLGTGLALRVVSFSLTGLIPVVRGLSVAFGALAVMGAVAAAPFKLLLLAFSPLGLMFLGAAAAGVALMANWDKLKAKATDLKDSIVRIFSSDEGGVINWFKGLFGSKNKGESIEVSSLDFISPTRDSAGEESLKNFYIQGVTDFFSSVKEGIKGKMQGGIRKSVQLSFDLILPEDEFMDEMRTRAAQYVKAMRDSFVNALSATSGGVKKVIKLGVDLILPEDEFVEGMQERIKESWVRVKNAISSAVPIGQGGVRKTIKLGVNLILPEDEFVEGLRERIGEAWKKARDTITGVLSTTGGGIKKVVKLGIDLILPEEEFVEGLRERMKSAWQRARNAITGSISASGGGIGKVIKLGVDLVLPEEEFVEGLKERIKNSWTTVRDSVSSIVPASRGVKRVIKLGIDLILPEDEFVEGLKERIKESWQRVRDSVRGIIPTGRGGITRVIRLGVDLILPEDEFVEGLRERIRDSWISVRDSIRSIVPTGQGGVKRVIKLGVDLILPEEEFVEGLKERIKESWQRVRDTLRSVVPAGRGGIRRVINLGVDLILPEEEFIEGLKERIRDAWISVRESIKSFVPTAQGQVKRVVSLGIDLILPEEEFVEGLKERIRASWKTLKDSIQGSVPTGIIKNIKLKILPSATIGSLEDIDIGGLFKGVKTSLTTQYDEFKKFVSGLFPDDGIAGVIKKILFPEGVTKTIQITDDDMDIEIFTDDIEVIMPGASFLGKIMSAFDVVRDSVGDQYNRLANYISGLFPDGGLMGLIKSIMYPLSNARQYLKNLIKRDDLVASVMHTDQPVGGITGEGYDPDLDRGFGINAMDQLLKQKRYSKWMNKDASEYQSQRQSNYEMLKSVGLGHFLETPGIIDQISTIFSIIPGIISLMMNLLKNAILVLMPSGIIGYIKGILYPSAEGGEPSVSYIPMSDQFFAIEKTAFAKGLESFKGYITTLMPAGIMGVVLGKAVGTTATTIGAQYAVRGGLNIAKGMSLAKFAKYGIPGVIAFLLMNQDVRDKIAGLLSGQDGEEESIPQSNISFLGFGGGDVAQDGGKMDMFIQKLKEMKAALAPIKEGFLDIFSNQYARFAGVVGGDLFTKALINLSAFTEHLKKLGTEIPNLKKVDFIEYLGPLFAAMIGFASASKAMEGLFGLFTKQKKGPMKGKRPVGVGASALGGLLSGSRKASGKGVLLGLMKTVKHPAILGIVGAGLAAMAVKDMFTGIGQQMDYGGGPETEDFFSNRREKPRGFVGKMAKTAKETFSPMLFEKMTDSMKRLTKNVLDFRGPEGKDLAETLGWFLGQLANILMVAVTVLTNSLNALVLVMQKLVDIYNYWFDWNFGDWFKGEGKFEPKKPTAVPYEESQAYQKYSPLKELADRMVLSPEQLAARRMSAVNESLHSGTASKGNIFTRFAKKLGFFNEPSTGGGVNVAPLVESLMYGGNSGGIGQVMKSMGTPPQASLAPGYMGGSSRSGSTIIFPQLNIYSQPGMSEEDLANATTRQIQLMLNNTVQDLADREVA